MKRRRNSKRKREHGEKFSFARLEPRKLLAADGFFSATMDADFAATMLVETVEQVCLHAEESGEGEAAESTEQHDNLQNEFQAEACNDEPREEVDENEVDEDEVQVDDGSEKTDSADSNVQPNLPSRILFLNDYEGSIKGSQASRFLISRDTEVVTQDGRETPGTRARISEPATLGYEAAPLSLLRNDLAETAPLEVQVEVESEEGVVFNETTESDPGGRELGNAGNESSTEVGMLGQRQLFALISPTEIGRSDSPSGPMTNPADSGSNLQPLATRLRSIPVVGQIQGNDVGSTSDSVVGPQRTPVINVKTQFNVDTRSSSGVAPAGLRPVGQTVEQNVSGSNSILPYAMLDRLFGNYGASIQQPVESNSSSSEGSKDESASDDRIARSVQIVESAIILIGLPSSRVCRDGEAKGKPGV